MVVHVAVARGNVMHFTCVCVAWRAHSCQAHLDLEQAILGDAFGAQLISRPTSTPAVQHSPAEQWMKP
jgi:hypothetical protein